MMTIDEAAAAAGLGRVLTLDSQELTRSLTLTQYANLLRSEAENQGDKLADWMCRFLDDRDDSQLKVEMLDLIAEHMGVLPIGTVKQ